MYPKYKHEDDRQYDVVEIGFNENGEALEDILAMYLTDEDMRKWEE